MSEKEQMSQQLEWRINASDGTSKVLGPERGLAIRVWQRVNGLIIGFVMKIWRFMVEAWTIGVGEPKKFIHCVKVGLALSAVSLFYYMRPLYESVGGNAMWAIMTVIVVLEYTVGATICKCINRAMATIVAGSLGVGIHWIASHCGPKFEPIILGVSVFIFASLATFSRFIPIVKARFDYGAMIFILTFSLVSISGYRADKLIMLARQRASTIAIGTSLCVLISMLFWPVWAGEQLHRQTITNLDKLATSLESYVAEYFNDGETANIAEEDLNKKLQGYKCLLNSKATEETMCNLARWEPAHGHFYFGYPWRQYLQIGAAARTCAYCVDNLSTCIDSDMQAPEFLKNHIKDKCMKLSFCSSKALRELSTAIKTRRRSSSIDLLTEEMSFVVQELHTSLQLVPYQIALPLTTSNGEKLEKPNKASVLEVLPLGTLVTLLIETATRIEEVILAVDKLASIAVFKNEEEKKSETTRPSENIEISCRGQEAMKTAEMV